MQVALSPTGSPIIGTADTIPGNALISSFTRSSDGSLECEFAGETDVCWGDQRTLQSGGLEDAAPAMLAALKEIADNQRVMDTMLTPQTRQAILDAIAAAEAPAKDLYVDENGQEWTEDQITLIDSKVFEAAHVAGYDVFRHIGEYTFVPPGGTYNPTSYDSAGAAWLAAIAHMRANEKVEA